MQDKRIFCMAIAVFPFGKMNLAKLLFAAFSFCLCPLFMTSCGGDDGVISEKTENPDGGGTKDEEDAEGEGQAGKEWTLADFAGRWNCMVETWDLSQKGVCTEVDPSNLSPVRDAEGNYVTVGLDEYCRAFADAYNAAYIPQ